MTRYIVRTTALASLLLTLGAFSVLPTHVEAASVKKPKMTQPLPDSVPVPMCPPDGTNGCGIF